MANKKSRVQRLQKAGTSPFSHPSHPAIRIRFYFEKYLFFIIPPLINTLTVFLNRIFYSIVKSI